VAGRQDGVVAERQESREELGIRDEGDTRKARHDRPYVEAEDRSMMVGEKRAWEMIGVTAGETGGETRGDERREETRGETSRDERRRETRGEEGREERLEAGRQEGREWWGIRGGADHQTRRAGRGGNLARRIGAWGLWLAIKEHEKREERKEPAGRETRSLGSVTVGWRGRACR
jgi:hypothetical protein